MTIELALSASAAAAAQSAAQNLRTLTPHEQAPESLLQPIQQRVPPAPATCEPRYLLIAAFAGCSTSHERYVRIARENGLQLVYINVNLGGAPLAAGDIPPGATEFVIRQSGRVLHLPNDAFIAATARLGLDSAGNVSVLDQNRLLLRSFDGYPSPDSAIQSYVREARDNCRPIASIDSDSRGIA
ncbi:MAG: hypothetical protein J0M34_08210 [Alphaproteobacteria bacterium]|nr:hypothetical protein [Alphaproteobacteria bacterium]